MDEQALKQAEAELLLDLAVSLMGACNDKDVARVVYNNRFAFRDVLNDWHHQLIVLHTEYEQETK